MEARYLRTKDYSKLKGWWEKWKWTPIPQQSLPDNGKGGIMVYDENNDICAGFLYLTNSDMGWIEFIISNPEVKEKSIRKDALVYLIENLSKLAKDSGVRVIFISVQNKGLEQRYIDAGFIQTDKSVNNLVKIL